MKFLLFIALYIITATAFCTEKQLVTIKKGSSVTLHGNGQHSKKYQWFRNGLPLENESAETLKTSEAGVYSVISFNEANCTSVPSEPIEVTVSEAEPPIDLSVSIKSDSKHVGIGEPFEYYINVRNNGPVKADQLLLTDVLPFGVELTELPSPAYGKVDYNSATRTISWSFDHLESGQSIDLRVRATASRKGTIEHKATITAMNEDVNLSNNLAMVVKEIRGLEIPNVITPNGDNKNERFEIPELNTYADNELTILNRWGTSVYMKKAYQNEWNGDNLNEGTYFYILKVKTEQGEWKAHKGYLTVLRKG